jgi:NADH-quinone oxidoreductase subunit J
VAHGDLPLFYTFHFYLFAIIAVVSAVLFVTRKSPVAAALWLVNTMFCLAALYVLLDAQFIGAIQVLVYAGAIMVVFLFVIMLLNLGDPRDLGDARSLGWKLVAGGIGVAIMAQLFALTRVRVIHPDLMPGYALGADMANRGAIAPIAGPLFRDYLLAFEITSVLLLAAIVGAVVLAKKRDPGTDAVAGGGTDAD